jgi:two-component system, chemotaxis family, response regulator PixG
MTTLPIGRYRFFQKLQPLSVLAKITSNSVTGCLQVYSASATWSIYIEEGKLTYACCSDKMFERLYRHLNRLSERIPTLPSKIHEQLRAIFETGIDNQAIPNPDYLAICWLVNQKYITHNQAAIVVEQLALEVLELLLNLEEGSYELTTESFLDDMPKFCHLSLRLLVEQCQRRYSQRRGSTGAVSQKSHRVYPTVSEQKRLFPNSNPAAEYSHPVLPHNLTNKDNHKRQSLSHQNTENKVYKIFCIDDSPTALSAIKSFLDEQIFSVVGANDPLKALMQILRTKPDIILLDISMPNLNGYELCSLLRKHSYFKNTPVIMVTARTGFIDRAKAKMVRSSGYLTKPFTKLDLLKAVFQHIM